MSAFACISPAISTEVRHRLRQQIAAEHSITIIEADRIITDTISFLTVCATNPHKQFRPSKQVDIGWHQFILNTHDYADFCDRTAGRFIHHVPEEFVAPVRRATADVLAPTVEAIKAAGLPFHPGLWSTGEGRCSQCHAGCTNCGQGGGEDPN
ncbi:glycine-rich domain-containing protein [Lentzea sp. E54]|uniref:glycine-rich domain-containing protein n=1 Tax=Lentzea xerophila TaxID=3435883 RepID=UPI003DA580EB